MRRAAIAAMAAALALSSCSRDASPPLPAAPDAALPLADAGAEAGANDRDAAPATPSDRQGIVDALCGAPSDAGCECPSFASEWGRDGPSKLEVGTTYAGAFSGPDRTEAVVTLGGCVSGARSGLTYGSHVLMRREGSTWSATAWTPRALHRCFPIESAARVTRLVCETHAGHMGLYHESFALLGYRSAPGAPPQEDEQVFLEFWTEDLAQGSRVLSPRHFEVLGREAFAAGNEGALSVELDVTSIIKCRRNGCDGGVDIVTLPLRFRYDHSALRVAPESRGALARLKERALAPP